MYFFRAPLPEHGRRHEPGHRHAVLCVCGTTVFFDSASAIDSAISGGGPSRGMTSISDGIARAVGLLSSARAGVPVTMLVRTTLLGPVWCDATNCWVRSTLVLRTRVYKIAHPWNQFVEGPTNPRSF